MSLEASVELTEDKEPEISLPFPKAWWGRALYGAYVVILPIISFWLVEAIKPTWQSGELSAYAALLLLPEASAVFLILLAYSIIGYLFLLVQPTQYARSFFIRFGVYTGTLLALQYSVLLSLYTFHPYLFLLWIFPIVYGWVYRWATHRWEAKIVNIFSIFLLAAIVLFVAASMDALTNIPLLLVAALLAPAPIWCFLLASRAALWLFKNYETSLSLSQGVGMAGWVGAYLAAWGFDVLKMYKLYAALPTQPPCYIATAAARGHPRVVRAWTVQRADGRSLQVNEQLQRLKCAELALMAVHPPLHRFVRRIYDVIGQRLARRIQNPFLADAAYLLLKPLEWSVTFVLKLIVPEIHSIAKKMYVDR